MISIRGTLAIGFLIVDMFSAVGGARADPPSQLATCRPVWEQTLPLQFYERDVTVPMEVEGHATQFVFDTGTSDTYILRDGKVKFNLPRKSRPDWRVNTTTGPKSNAEFVDVKNLRFAGRDLGFRTMPVDDFGYAPTSPARAVETGLLGVDLLKDLEVDIDIPDKQIVLYRFDAACRDVHPSWAFDYTTIPIKLRRSGVPMVPIAINGVTIDAIFDTGGAQTVLQYDEDDENDYAKLGKAAEGNPNWLCSLALGGRPQRLFDILTEHKPLASSNGTRLGIDFIGRQRFWLSLSSKRLFMKSEPMR